MPIEIPDDFYRRVAARHERPVAEPEKRFTIQKELPPTKLRVYEDRRRRSFRAKVVAVEGEAGGLAPTFFFPEGGGEGTDPRAIGPIGVYEVPRAGPSCLHLLRRGARRPPGTPGAWSRFRSGTWRRVAGRTSPGRATSRSSRSCVPPESRTASSASNTPRGRRRSRPSGNSPRK